MFGKVTERQEGTDPHRCVGKNPERGRPSARLLMRERVCKASNERLRSNLCLLIEICRGEST